MMQHMLKIIWIELFSEVKVTFCIKKNRKKNIMI